MKKIDRRTFIGGFFTFLGTSMISTCKYKEVGILDTVYKTANKNQLNTYFDDLLSCKVLNLTTFHSGEEVKITIDMLDAVNILEKSIEMNDLLKSINISVYNPLLLDEEAENKVLDLEYDEIEELLYNYHNLNDDEKNILGYLKIYYDKWYKNNGLVISKELLISVLENFGYQIDNDAEEVVVNFENDELVNCIVITKNKRKEKYIIDEESSQINEIIELLNSIQKVLNDKKRNFDILDIDGSKRDNLDVQRALDLTKKGSIIEVTSSFDGDIKKLKQANIVSDSVLDNLKINHR